MNVTKFLCWSLAINKTSFLNSFPPCVELFESLFTAICRPFKSVPWKYSSSFIEKNRELHNKYYHIYPPCKLLQIHLCRWNFHLQSCWLLLQLHLSHIVMALKLHFHHQLDQNDWIVKPCFKLLKEKFW